MGHSPLAADFVASAEHSMAPLSAQHSLPAFSVPAFSLTAAFTAASEAQQEPFFGAGAATEAFDVPSGADVLWAQETKPTRARIELAARNVRERVVMDCLRTVARGYAFGPRWVKDFDGRPVSGITRSHEWLWGPRVCSPGTFHGEHPQRGR